MMIQVGHGCYQGINCFWKKLKFHAGKKIPLICNGTVSIILNTSVLALFLPCRIFSNVFLDKIELYF